MNKSVVKLTPIGGQAENGKSMYCLEIDDQWFIIDAGYRFPEVDKLGVDVIIPNFDYLKENKDKIKAIFITHGHDDVMGALPYLLQEVNVPIYTTDLTADLIDQLLQRYMRHSHVSYKYKIKRVNMNATIKVAGVTVEFFPITHSIPGSVGLAFLTPNGYVVYSSEFIIDFGAPERFRCNIQKMMEIGKKGVLALLCESSYSKNDGYTSPKHKLTDKIESIFEDATGRIIISSYAQNAFRTQEIAQLAKKYNRKICFYGRDKYDNTNTIMRIARHTKRPILDIHPSYIADSKAISDKKNMDKLVVLLSGSPRRIYHDILDIIDGGDEKLKLQENDTFIVASPVLPGTEKIANRAINELYKTDTQIHVLKNKELQSMHASEEDIKVLIQILNPKYFIPIKGEYQHFVAVSDVAKKMSIKDDNIIIVDNGEIITFNDGKLQDYRDSITIEDVMIDGLGIGDVGVKVIDDRNQLQNDGVVIIGMTIDGKTKEIVANTDVQTRGFIYLKDSENIVRAIIEMAEKELEAYKKDDNGDIRDVRQTIKDKANRYIIKETGKRPVILPVIIEL
ncbi:ribonuclease J [Faecalibacillus faecis]|uniref:ribonuclease J n=1 Tax=Faecalibacillus faecis TaxID=1982628 RepID=UPI000664C267|nr:ribonuclease J [Faecalibacillus faecis]KMV79143.1 metallo-beta lactamase hydrolase [Coprobacillus sp. 8_1_38FAA]RGT63563.1 MBL fold hydrolase [Coprobacillus sp. AF18-40]RGT85141.1 MBL fold hydrolase [Coprobacillus sp. AF18-15LB]RHH14290.1 MBL fold hydrolase [Coprobacillus sp. AM18-4LB-d2]RHP28311.1 MBL fold hydrolase [Coprobacillus sp. AF34-1BH]RHQ86771.1 MBL fold hydrolase [Coprobacillus sp. AF21-8LB]